MTGAPVSSYLKRRVRSREEVMLLSALKRMLAENSVHVFTPGSYAQAMAAIEEAEKAT